MNANMGGAERVPSVALHDLTDRELIARLKGWAGAEREATAEVIRHLVEVDRRMLWAMEGFSSLYTYTVEGLGFSEQAALRRIRVARLSQRMPEVTEALRLGDVHLAGLVVLGPLLQPDNVNQWLWRARGKSKRAIEEMVAAERPARVGEDERRMRALPLGMAERGGPAAGAPGGAAAEGAADGRGGSAGAVAQGEAHEALVYRFSFAASAAFEAKYAEARALLSHAVPDGDAEAILSRALDLLITKTKKRRFGTTGERRRAEPGAGAKGEGGEENVSAGAAAAAAPERGRSGQAGGAEPDECPRGESVQAGGDEPGDCPRGQCGGKEGPAGSRSADRPQPGGRGPSGGRGEGETGEVDLSRYIPADIRRAVYERDGGECVYISPDGHCCESREKLEYHHRIAWGRRGKSLFWNLELRCRAHNGLASLLEYGPELWEYLRRQREEERARKEALGEGAREREERPDGAREAGARIA